jgi:hypothetical protein
MNTPSALNLVPIGSIEAENRLLKARYSIQSTVAALLASGKGILAADESFPTIGKRFAALNIPSTEENRLAYRLERAPSPAVFSGAVDCRTNWISILYRLPVYL